MIEFTGRALRFFSRNVSRNTAYLFDYALNYFNPGFVVRPSYLSEDELVAALKEGKSFIRFGDGEIYLINFGNIYFQKYDARLRAYLLKIIQEYDPESRYILGIPETYLGMMNAELKKKQVLYCYLPFKLAFRKLFRKDVKYSDTHLFYRKDSFTRVLEGMLGGKKVLFVTSLKNWNLMKNEGIQEKLVVEFIECKETDSFDEFDALKRAIEEKVGSKVSEYRVVAAAGPASKALLYELSKEGIIGYDLGRGVEAVYRTNTIEALF